MTFEHLPIALALSATAIGAVTDLRTGHIPNRLTFGGLLLGPVLHFALHVREGLVVALEASGFSVVGALACAAVPLVLWLIDENAILPGDIKMIGAVGALLRPMVGVEATFYGFIAAALFAPARMAWEGKLMKTLGNTFALVVNPFLPKEKRRKLSSEMMTQMRFGPFIFAGVLGEAAMQWLAAAVSVARK
jgi:prepilin peptidase CpaA